MFGVLFATQFDAQATFAVESNEWSGTVKPFVRPSTSLRTNGLGVEIIEASVQC